MRLSITRSRRSRTSASDIGSPSGPRDLGAARGAQGHLERGELLVLVEEAQRRPRAETGEPDQVARDPARGIDHEGIVARASIEPKRDHMVLVAVARAQYGPIDLALREAQRPQQVEAHELETVAVVLAARQHL